MARILLVITIVVVRIQRVIECVGDRSESLAIETFFESWNGRELIDLYTKLQALLGSSSLGGRSLFRIPFVRGCKQEVFQTNIRSESIIEPRQDMGTSRPHDPRNC